MTKSILKRIIEDKASFWVQRYDRFNMFCLLIYSKIIVLFVSKIRNVKIHNHCQFYGIPHFRRFPFSSISIGENCIFRSDHTSNLIGVNHKCILSTHSKEARIVIGNNSGFSGTSIGAEKEIRIGNNVLVNKLNYHKF